LKAVCREYYERIKNLESEKFDLEKEAEAKEHEVEEIHIQVNNGKL